MTTLHKATRLLVAGIFVQLVALLPAAHAETITCESHGDKREYCEVARPWEADIELAHRLSKSPCEEGSSWGRDKYGVWVEDGCRAEFAVLRRGEDRDRRDSRYDERPREPARVVETCPRGFESGSHRCSPDERRRGCKDMKMPGGTTCNSVGWGR